MHNCQLIYVIDDDEPVRRSTQFMLQAAGYTVESYASAGAFLNDAPNLRPGCVLLDIRMPEMDGLAAQVEIGQLGIALPVIVLTGHGDVSIAVQAMKHGAVDFLEKPFEKSQLLIAIESALEGLDDRREERISAHDADRRIAALTPRETEVLRGLVSGEPNKRIAYQLGISPRTVEAHRAHLMAKLKVRSFSQALRIAFAAGLDQSLDDALKPK